jgi:hypothetical protein
LQNALSVPVSRGVLSELQEFWRELRGQEQENVRRLKQFVAEHIE